ncbi:hypothetical protein [Litoribacter populi]|uniref:hypothetical protein n=1 Tax=Litoribacter populi TaxID=2598460 RepID=UPI00117EB63D|nr:hypothetical protein [Litoribacter populi]
MANKTSLSGQLEKKSKIAKPLRLIGILILIIQQILWLELFDFPFSKYLPIATITIFSIYFINIYIVYKNLKQSK